MVYRLAKPERKRKGWFLKHVVLRQGLLMMVFIALLWLLIPLDWYVYAPAFLVAVMLVSCQNWVSTRRFERRFEKLGTQFVTLTEAGILVESEGAGIRSFVPWERISRAWLHMDMLMVQQTNGLFHLLPTESLRRERAGEMLAYVKAHARKKQAPPTAPPAALLSENPARVSVTPSQWREFVDYIMQEAVPGRTVVSHVALFILGLIIPLCWGYELYALVLPLLVIGVGFVIMVKYPGLFARAMRKEPSPGYLHVCRDAVLVQSDNGAWAALPTSLIDGAVQLRHGIAYRTQILSFVLADSTPAPSPYLPQPVKLRRWLHRGWIALALFVLPLLANFAYFMLAAESENTEFSKAMERGEALSRYVEEVMPPMQYPGSIVWCCLMVYPECTVVSCAWESELEVDVMLYTGNEAGQPEDCPADEE